jgi:hypothetical protein
MSKTRERERATKRDCSSEEIVHEGRPVALLGLIMGITFAASFPIFLASPLPLPVHQPLAALPSLPSSSSTTRLAVQNVMTTPEQRIE